METFTETILRLNRELRHANVNAKVADLNYHGRAKWLRREITAIGRRRRWSPSELQANLDLRIASDIELNNFFVQQQFWSTEVRRIANTIAAKTAVHYAPKGVTGYEPTPRQGIA